MRDYTEMRKKLQIGDPVWGIVNAPNNVALEVHANSGTGIRAKTWTVNDAMLSVYNTNNGSTSADVGYNGRNTFAVYGDGRVMIKSLQNLLPVLTIGKYTNTSSSDTGTSYFKVYSDGRLWMRSSGANTQMLTINNGSNDVVKVYGDGRVYIGQQIPLTGGVHQDAMLSVDGKIIAKKFFVTTKPGVWGDDEFERKINLDSLENEINYALKNKHFRDIKSAREIEEEGIEINETIAFLVRKIERLYLYVNMLYEENKQLKREMKNK